MARKRGTGNVVIEYPMQGATYFEEKYGVYEYGFYERGSVLVGRQKRVFLDSFDTLAEAQAAYPDAAWHGTPDGKGVGSGYVEDRMLDLPGDDDPDPKGEDREAYEDGLAEGRD